MTAGKVLLAYFVWWHCVLIPCLATPQHICFGHWIVQALQKDTVVLTGLFLFTKQGWRIDLRWGSGANFRQPVAGARDSLSRVRRHGSLMVFLSTCWVRRFFPQSISQPCCPSNVYVKLVYDVLCLHFVSNFSRLPSQGFGDVRPQNQGRKCLYMGQILISILRAICR